MKWTHKPWRMRKNWFFQFLENLLEGVLIRRFSRKGERHLISKFWMFWMFLRISLIPYPIHYPHSTMIDLDCVGSPRQHSLLLWSITAIVQFSAFASNILQTYSPPIVFSYWHVRCVKMVETCSSTELGPGCFRSTASQAKSESQA